MNEKTKVLIAEDEGIIREALCFLVNSYEGMAIVGVASNGREAVNATFRTRPDVVLMDLKMPIMDGIEATLMIKEKLPSTKVIALTAATDTKRITEAFSAGFDGFVVKKSSGEELKAAINSILDGKRFICPEAAMIIADSYLAKRKKDVHSPFADFNKVETDILNHICEGLRASDIATRLGLSKKTVEKYRDNIRLKAGVNTAAELVAVYMKFLSDKNE